ncbi:DUF397 domain-containing protein [Yinghuangia sp. KLBMP8922]|uniref:DUF397 domain-containing protein n=2 Tax=Yinghuangia soli TaxID=2908204 RepID=A0AA41Q1H4_9ACTN|nr:DUF397 domain-containing protein [Yinghuangia soli]
MSDSREYRFATAAACRDPKVGNCIEVATNVQGAVALRESENPSTVVVTTPERWAVFVAAAAAGEFDLTM